MSGFNSFGSDGRGDFVGVGGGGRDEAGADDGRELPLVFTGAVDDGLGERNLDADLLAGNDVGDALREDVGALLVEQCGVLAVLFGLLVNLGGFLAFFDLA